MVDLRTKIVFGLIGFPHQRMSVVLATSSNSMHGSNSNGNSSNQRSNSSSSGNSSCDRSGGGLAEV